MSSDPLGLFEAKQAPSPVAQPQSGGWGLAAFVLVIVLAVVAWDKFGHGGSDDSGGDERGSLRGSMVVFVTELQKPSLANLEAWDAMKDFEQARGMARSMRLDEEMPEAQGAVSYAASKGVEPPLMVLVKDKAFVDAAPFSEDATLADVEAWLE